MHISQQPTTYTLNLANRIYTEKSLVLQKKFVEIMQEKFEGEIYTMDSDKPSETAKVTILFLLESFFPLKEKVKRNDILAIVK